MNVEKCPVAVVSQDGRSAFIDLLENQQLGPHRLGGFLGGGGFGLVFEASDGAGDKIAFAVIESGLTLTTDNFFVF